MLKKLLEKLEDNQEVTAVTIRDAKSGKEITFARKGEDYVVREGDKEKIILKVEGERLIPQPIEGEVYPQDSWSCYEKCMQQCSSDYLICAKLCGEKCGIY